MLVRAVDSTSSSSTRQWEEWTDCRIRAVGLSTLVLAVLKDNAKNVFSESRRCKSSLYLIEPHLLFAKSDVFILFLQCASPGGLGSGCNFDT